MWIKRIFESKVDDLKALPIRILTGPRQSGKSALLAHVLKNRARFLSLDDLQNRLLASQDPAMFLGPELEPLILDEARDPCDGVLDVRNKCFSKLKLWVHESCFFFFDGSAARFRLR